MNKRSETSSITVSLISSLVPVAQGIYPSEKSAVQMFCVYLSFLEKASGWVSKLDGWKDELNKKLAGQTADSIVELVRLNLPRQIEFALQRMSGVFFREVMVRFEVSVTEMEKWGEIGGVASWKKDFLRVVPGDYPLEFPQETIRRMQILAELSRQEVPITEPWVAVRKMYHPNSANLVVRMNDNLGGCCFSVYTWPISGIKSSFGKLIPEN